MTRLYLVRHGKATGGWDTDPDPGLDRIGREQAEEAGARLAPLGPLPIVSSPLRRCRETSAPLARTWGVTPEIRDAVAEIPTPEGMVMGERTPWLRGAMQGTWADLGDRFTAYRDGVVAVLLGLEADTVVVSHFIAINAVIGAIVGDDHLVIRALDNCSITVVDVVEGRIHLVEGGHEADTFVR